MQGLPCCNDQDCGVELGCTMLDSHKGCSTPCQGSYSSCDRPDLSAWRMSTEMARHGDYRSFMLLQEPSSLKPSRIQEESPGQPPKRSRSGRMERRNSEPFIELSTPRGSLSRRSSDWGD